MKKYFVMIGNVIGFSIILQVCAIIIGKIWWNENIIPKKFAQDNIIMTSVLTFSLTILCSGILYKLQGRDLLKTVNLSKMKMKDFIITTSIGILMGIFTCCLCNISIVVEKLPVFQEYLYSSVNVYSNIVVFVIMFALMFGLEEIVFRGIFFNEFRQNTSLTIAVILGTAVYGLINFASLGTAVGIYAIIAGVFYTLAYVYAKSMYAPILLQITSMYVITFFIKSGLWLKLRELSDIVIISFVLVLGIAIVFLYYVLYLNYENKRMKRASVLSA